MKTNIKMCFRATLLMACLLIISHYCFADSIKGLSEVPKSIQLLSVEIQGRKPAEIRSLIIKRFGNPQRDIGSGVSIEQWDVESGVLSLSQLGGSPTFTPKAGKPVLLLPTKNVVLENLFESFEMTTFPDKNNHNNRIWIGNVHLDKDNTYTYVMKGFNNLNKEQKIGQKNNFFILNPNGSFNIRFIDGYTQETLLEDISDETKFCEIEFLSKDGSQKQIYGIVSTGRRLRFISENSPFDLYKFWENN